MSQTASATTKHCTGCDADLPIEAFGRRADSHDGVQSRCRLCRNDAAGMYRATSDQHARSCRAWRLKTVYGLDQESLNALAAAQGYACRGCGQHLDAGHRGTANIDHCHVNGHVRGLLCRMCNLTLGHARDDPHTLRRLADYLT